jgi:E3 ubiquitin-protein ligase RNF115/126
MLRLLAHAPSQRSPPQLDVLPYEDEFFRLELNSRNEIEDEDEDDGNEEEEEEEDNLTVNDEEDDDDEEEEEGEGGGVRMFHQPRIFPLTTRSRTGRNRILDWAEILMGIEDNSIEFRMESDRYAGNPADYVDDAAGYEALLQNLTEGDGGRKGAPPAAKSAIEALETFEVGSCDKEGEMVVVCAVCKDSMVKGETVKKLPCGHCYHGNCIVPWLGTRNSCPVCRFQLPTDDAEYEEDRKRTSNSAAAASSSSTSRF